MPEALQNESARHWMEQSRRVHSAYRAVCDLTRGSSDTPQSDSFAALMETLNRRLDECLCAVEGELEMAGEEVSPAQAARREKIVSLIDNYMQPHAQAARSGR